MQKRIIPLILIIHILVQSWLDLSPLQAGDSTFTLLSEEERAWLDQNPDKLTLFFNTEFPPIEFISPNGKFIGLGADIIAMVEKRLGVSFRKSPCLDWNEHLAALERGECAIAPVIVRNEEREDYAFFTVPYATAPVVMITTAGKNNLTLDELDGKRVAVVSGFVTEKYLRDRNQGQFNIVTVNNVIDGLHDVSFGQVDVLVENLAVAAYYIQREGIPNLKVAGVTDYAFAWSIGVSRHYPLLFSAIEKALTDIPQNDLETIRKHWISLSAPGKLDPQTILLLKLTALFTVLLVLSLALVTIILKRRLNERLDRLKQALVELHESERRYVQAVSATTDAIWEWDLITDRTYFSPRWYEMLGYADHEFEMTIESWKNLCHPDDVDSTLASIHETIQASDSGKFTVEYRIRTKSGSWRWILGRGDVVKRDGNGIPVVLCGTNTDATDQKKLQSQLIQAQKMEAVGRLAGGVAHDFNNMLCVISGYTELALTEVDPKEPIYNKLVDIQKAANYATNLTRQLLAFARRQTIDPKVIDLNETIDGLLKMLQRLIGENISLVWRPAESLWWIKMDPSQIDQILANLCVNARDAIHDVGTISIASKNLVFDESFCNGHTGFLPGEYVSITVSDNGCGMDKETQSQIFEPFFTTKGLGKGTGLGLATVYGIVKQNHGFINLYSEVDRGSIFSIYIPRHTGESSGTLTPGDRDIPSPQGETILMVEDDPMILDLGQNILETQGYNVLAAATTLEAIRLAEEHKDPIHLLLTDVIMPEMNGRDLARKILALHPNLKCLYMSGYTSDVIARHGVLEEGVQFIQKPFTIQELTIRIREMLDRV